jgi:AcrR family transcriptional regulator
MLTMVNRKRGDDPLPPAMAVLLRDGPGALTMRNVAAEAGVTATALYRHYPGKDALVKAVVKATYEIFRRHLITEVEGGDPITWLRIAADRFLRFALDYPNYYRLLFEEPHGFGIDRYPDDFRKGKSPTFRQLRDLVHAAIESGALAGKPANAGDIALTFYAHLHGLIMLRLAGRFPDDAAFQRFYGQSVERLFQGLKA